MRPDLGRADVGSQGPARERVSASEPGHGPGDQGGVSTDRGAPRDRRAPFDLAPQEFRELGHRVVDRVAELLASIRERPLTPGDKPSTVRSALGQAGLPDRGAPPARLLDETADLLIAHSLLNGHPRFWGYITASPSPIGALGDLLAASINPNVGAWDLSPIASEIEAQTIRWIAELIGYDPACGGLLVSGGNMANFVGFLAARRAKAGWDVRAQGMAGGAPLAVYGSRETHTWIQKAADLFGLGTDAIRWIGVDAKLRLDLKSLRDEIAADRRRGVRPFLVVGSAGTVSTGAVDPLPAIAEICRAENLWFHVDGAYGAPAAALPEADPDLKGLSLADSLALDPHKWLYSPLEAGCVLVRDPRHLADTFTYRPAYYHFGEFDEPLVNYHEIGPQNSRGFRALKVWLGMRQVGREGHARMIREDIALAGALHRATASHPEMEALTLSLSIATFRYVPTDLPPETPAAEEYLNELNREILERLQSGGEAFVSNAILDGRFVLRACIVNFRTTLADVEALPAIVARIGRELDAGMRPVALRAAP
jgi:glutamate/tyrosine decarboxylase-like PLP-dependent enzyme